MRSLSPREFDELISSGEPVGRNDEGVSVWRLGDGRFVKVFRRGRMLSSVVWNPYAARFRRAASLLRERGVPSVEMEDALRIEDTGRTAVIYRGLPGRTARSLLADAHDLLPRIAAFLATLHAKGVYFRGAHFGNIIVLEGDHEIGGMGLIDVAAAQFRSRALRPALRARNFKPPLRYDVDRSAIERFGPAQFVACYLRASNMSEHEIRSFRARLSAIDPFYADAAKGASQT